MQYGKILLVLVLLVSPSAMADSSTHEQDYAALVRAMKPFTHELTKPFYVYNWHTPSEGKPLPKQAQTPESFAAVQAVANRYWEKQTDPDSYRHPFGTGLYMAVDPVVTRGYGGTSRWALTEVRLPTGLRLIDVQRDDGATALFAVRDLLVRLGCPRWPDNILRSMVAPSTYRDHPQCATTLKRLLRDDLKIDGFAYPYTGTVYKSCPARSVTNSGTAFVLTNGNKLRPEEVRVYSPASEDDEEGRGRVQGLFTVAHHEQYPDSAADGKPAPKETPTTLKRADVWADKFLWSNLEGKPFPVKLADWMRQNLYHCVRDDTTHRPDFPAEISRENNAEQPAVLDSSTAQ